MAKNSRLSVRKPASKSQDTVNDLDKIKVSFTKKETAQLKKSLGFQKDFFTRHRKISKMWKARNEGKVIPESQQRYLISTAVDAENNMNNVMQHAIKLVGGKKEVKDIYKKSQENPEHIRTFSHPAFWPESVRKQIKEIGITDNELIHYHHQIFNTKNWDKIQKSIKKTSFADIMKGAQKSIDNSEFPESVAALKEKGLISISGAEDLVGMLSVMAGVVAVIAEFYVLAVVLVVVGFLLIIDSIIKLPVLLISSPGDNSSSSDTYNNEYFIGNISPTKMEVHRSYCKTLSRLKPEHGISLLSLDEAHAKGLDNCYYCIGGSTR